MRKVLPVAVPMVGCPQQSAYSSSSFDVGDVTEQLTDEPLLLFCDWEQKLAGINFFHAVTGGEVFDIVREMLCRGISEVAGCKDNFLFSRFWAKEKSDHGCDRSNVVRLIPIKRTKPNAHFARLTFDFKTKIMLVFYMLFSISL